MPEPKEKKLTDEEADRRRDELARRILHTPHEPRKPAGKRKTTKKERPAK